MQGWHLDFFAADGALGGFVRLVLRERAEYWACLLGADRDAVVVIDRDLPRPQRGSLELRGSGVWTELACLVPNEHFTVQLEAFGAGLAADEPAHPEMRGDRVPLGFDLEWESDVTLRQGSEEAYALGCVVHGEILVGADRVDFEGFGTWRYGHKLDGPGCRTWARTDSGLWLLGAPGNRDGASRRLTELRIRREAPESDLILGLGRVRSPGGEAATGWIECSQSMKDS